MRTDSRSGRLLQRLSSAEWFGRHAPRFVPRLDRFVHRMTGGRVLLSNGPLPAILLTTTGARSGLPRATPLATVPYDGDHFVVGSNFGGESHPAWSYNLIAHPSATMSLKGVNHQIEAHLLSAEEKEAIWPVLTTVWPPYDRYVERSGRDIRVFRLVVVTA